MAERMDHDKMKQASELPPRGTKEPIPGELDPTTEAPTQPGIVGTTGYGTDWPEALTNDPTLSDETHQQNRWEGGGRGPVTEDTPRKE